MTFGEIAITAISSSGILLGLGALGGWLFKASVSRWIQHRFDLPLEQARSALKREEERVKADLAAGNSRIDALQSSVLSGLRSRNEMLDRRRIEAAEKIWATVIELQPLEQASIAAQTIKLDEAMRVAAQDDEEGRKIRKFASDISAAMGFDIQKLKPLTHVVDKERPFVSPMTWALFSTYRSVVVDPALRFALIGAGAPPKYIKNRDDLIAAAKVALPHMAKFIDDYKHAALPHLVDDLKERLLAELSTNLKDVSWSQRDLEQAMGIVKALDSSMNGETSAQAKAITVDVPAVQNRSP